MGYRVRGELARHQEGIVAQVVDLPLGEHVVDELPSRPNTGQFLRQVHRRLTVAALGDRLEQVDEVVEVGVLENVALDVVRDPVALDGLGPEKTTTLERGEVSRIRVNTSRPAMSGRPRSRTTTSGCSDAVIRTASPPSAASPRTSKPPRNRSAVRSRRRTSTTSSTSSTLMGTRERYPWPSSPAHGRPAGLDRSAGRGSEITKAPAGWSCVRGSYDASPPWARASSRTMKRPRPVPPLLSPVAKRSKRRGCMSAATPGPRSLTRISTVAGCDCTFTCTGEAP